MARTFFIIILLLLTTLSFGQGLEEEMHNKETYLKTDLLKSIQFTVGVKTYTGENSDAAIDTVIDIILNTKKKLT